MKKIFTLLLAVVFTYSGFCQIFSEGFENGGSIPNLWTQEYVTGTMDWTFVDGNGLTISAYNGSYNAFIFDFMGYYATKLISPEVDVTGATEPMISFWYLIGENIMVPGACDTLRVYYRTSTSGQWTLLTQLTTIAADWTNLEIAITDPSATYSLAFEGTTSNGIGVLIDDVQIFDNVEPPGCTTPVYPSDGATGITVSGELEWGSISGVNGYKLYFGTDADATNIENGTDLGNVTTFSFTDLSYVTQYYWKIVPYNDNGDAVDCDIWDFITGADPTVTTFPWNASFENGGDLPYGWVINSSAGDDWEIVSSVQTGTPSGPQDGSYFAEFFSATAGNSSYLITPPLDITGVSNPGVGFWYVTTTLVGQGTLGVYYKTSSGGTWTLLEEYSEPLTDWVGDTLSLPNASGDYYIGFQGSVDGISGCYVDNITVKEYTASVETVEGQNRLINVFPNPADDVLNIYMNSTGTNDMIIEISNLFGQVIKQMSLSGSDKYSVNVNDLAGGLYYIKVRTEDSMQVSKVVIR